MDNTPGSVTGFVNEVRAGKAESIKPIWDRYYDQLLKLARLRIQSSRTSTTVSDEEDVALSTIVVLEKGLREGRFAGLNDRDDLLRLLIRILYDKVLDLRRHETRIRRGGGKVFHESELAANGNNADVDDAPFDLIHSSEPTAEEKAIVGEEFRGRLEQLDKLGAPNSRRVAELTLEGFSTQEIAAELGYSRRTVELRLVQIRQLWGTGEIGS